MRSGLQPDDQPAQGCARLLEQPVGSVDRVLDGAEQGRELVQQLLHLRDQVPGLLDRQRDADRKERPDEHGLGHHLSHQGFQQALHQGSGNPTEVSAAQ
ncbi:hypothetical protein HJ590_03615 [Naumannella sp. ID2617S]|nr:hypothetical protein [Naumannella sp. ID2617S]